jgi:uncharacterized protein (DUF2252 family)
MSAPAANPATRTTARSRHPRRSAPARSSRGRSTRTRIARPSVDRLDPAERVARGKAARAAVPRENHAALNPDAGRPDPVSLLEGQAASRVASLVPIRYGRMLASPFGFYRGAALVMASDLAGTPASGLTVQACGDAHLSNFGFFASPERRLVFDVNDFDETLPAPWEWDVKRLAASLEVAARDNGFGARKRHEIVLAAVASYRTAMRDFAGQGNLKVWFTQEDVDDLRRRYESQLDQPARKKVARSAARAPDRDNLQELDKLCTLVDGRPRIVADPPLIVPLADLVADQVETGELAAAMSVLISRYRQTLQADLRLLIRAFQFTDMARKVVGVGSVGTRCWIILLLGRDERDPLFLQVKEAEPSVLSQFAGASEYDNQGQRVVAGQRLMQAASDVFLGWQRVSGREGQSRDFYVRSLRDWKLSADITAMGPRGMRTYGELCGWTLARAHARSGDRIAIGSYLGSKPVFDHAVAEFAAGYADQNEKDYQLLEAADQSGRITALRDV